MNICNEDRNKFYLDSQAISRPAPALAYLCHLRSSEVIILFSQLGSDDQPEHSLASLLLWQDYFKQDNINTHIPCKLISLCNCHTYLALRPIIKQFRIVLYQQSRISREWDVVYYCAPPRIKHRDLLGSVPVTSYYRRVRYPAYLWFYPPAVVTVPRIIKFKGPVPSSNSCGLRIRSTCVQVIKTFKLT